MQQKPTSSKQVVAIIEQVNKTGKNWSKDRIFITDPMFTNKTQ